MYVYISTENRYVDDYPDRFSNQVITSGVLSVEAFFVLRCVQFFLLNGLPKLGGRPLCV